MGKSFVYNDGSSNDDKKQNELRLEFGVFIDGTLNNKRNTETRKIVRGETDEHVIIDPDSKHHKNFKKKYPKKCYHLLGYKINEVLY